MCKHNFEFSCGLMTKEQIIKKVHELIPNLGQYSEVDFDEDRHKDLSCIIIILKGKKVEEKKVFLNDVPVCDGNKERFKKIFFSYLENL